VRVVSRWGATPDEAAEEFPCDRLCASADAAYLRAVTVRAAPATVFRWLCQLRVAPYSYDWVDNLGRRSPRALTPGAERLAAGQTVMTIFELRAFEPDRSLTVVNKVRRGGRALFGEVWVTYRVVPATDGASRLTAKVLVRHPPGLAGRLMRAVLPAGDLLMMRRQLLNLGALAEREERTRRRFP
jgi:hypothetical protein